MRSGTRISCFVLTMGLLAMAGAFVARAESAAPPPDWPQWRGLHRDGRVPALPRTMPSLNQMWKYAVAGSCDAGIAVADGLLVFIDRDEKNDYYRCLDAGKGTEIWSRSFPNDREMDYGPAPRATPLVHQGKVYVLSAFGEFYCFELKTGKTVWQKDFAKDFSAGKAPTWGYCHSPLLAQGKLILNPGAKASVVAVDAETGKVLWEGPGGKPNYSSFIAGSFGGVQQVVGHDDAALGGWDLATGKRLWSIPMEQGGGYIVPTPVNIGGRLLVTDNTNETQLFAFKDGVPASTPVAKSEDIAPEVMTPVVVGDLVLGLSKRLACLDAANELKTLWTLQDKMFKIDCHLIVAEDTGLAMSNRGEVMLFSFDRQGAKIVGRQKLCQRTLMHPTVVGTRLYLRDSELLGCYDLTPAP